jgi:hypothetical protein
MILNPEDLHVYRKFLSVRYSTPAGVEQKG